jgi:Nuclease-related domain
VLEFPDFETVCLSCVEGRGRKLCYFITKGLQINNLILILAIATPFLIVLATLFAQKTLLDRKGLRSPLNMRIYNTPGEQLRKRLEVLNENLLLIYMLVALTGPTMLCAWLLVRFKAVNFFQFKYGVGDWTFLVIAVFTIASAAFRMTRIVKERRKVSLGLTAEIVTAQHLYSMVKEGCTLFNDIPVDNKFNLDHVLVGSKAVFMVETKSRQKSSQRGQDSARVIYDGEYLMFPNGYKQKKPLEQARRQAAWLSGYLKEACGEPVKVIPVVALPGWYVDDKSPKTSDVYVINGKNSSFLNKLNLGPEMSRSLRNSIDNALRLKYPSPE